MVGECGEVVGGQLEAVEGGRPRGGHGEDGQLVLVEETGEDKTNRRLDWVITILETMVRLSHVNTCWGTFIESVTVVVIAHTGWAGKGCLSLSLSIRMVMHVCE